MPGQEKNYVLTSWIQEAKSEMRIDVAREEEGQRKHKALLTKVFENICRPLKDLEAMPGSRFSFECHERNDGAVIETNIPTISALPGFGSATTRTDGKMTIEISSAGEVRAIGDLVKVDGYYYDSTRHETVKSDIDNCKAALKFVVRQATLRGVVS